MANTQQDPNNEQDQALEQIRQQAEQTGTVDPSLNSMLENMSRQELLQLLGAYSGKSKSYFTKKRLGKQTKNKKRKEQKQARKKMFKCNSTRGQKRNKGHKPAVNY